MTVLFEKGAGEGSHYHDKDYLAAGATFLKIAKKFLQNPTLP